MLAATWSRGPRTCGAGGGDVVEAIYQSSWHSLAMQKVGQRLTDGRLGASVRCNGHDHPLSTVGALGSRRGLFRKLSTVGIRCRGCHCQRFSEGMHAFIGIALGLGELLSLGCA